MAKNLLDLLKPSGRLTYKSQNELFGTFGFLTGVAVALNTPRDIFEGVMDTLWKTFVEQDLYYRGTKLPSGEDRSDLFSSEIAFMRLRVEQRNLQEDEFAWMKDK